jgi:AmmeMemoRadiSam system protein A
VIDRAAALDVAVRAVLEPLRTHRRWVPDPGTLPPSLRDPGATFVTLRDGRTGELLGCIGSLVPRAPLGVDIAHNAAAAAFDDPRMPPVTLGEVDTMHVEVSVLSPLTPLAVTGWDDLIRRVQPGVDGLLVEAGPWRATLLPSVWESLPDVDAFLSALWRKAGLRPGSWPVGLVVHRYGTTQVEGLAREHRPAEAAASHLGVPAERGDGGS